MTSYLFKSSSNAGWREKLGSPPLTKRKIVLRAYSGHRLHVIGETTVDVNAGSQRHKSLPLVVVEGEEAPLFGRNWLVQVDVAWDVLKNTFVQECKTHAIVASCSQGQSPPTGARGNPIFLLTRLTLAPVSSSIFSGIPFNSTSIHTRLVLMPFRTPM